MIGHAMYISIITLWKKNKSKREIARITGHDRKTVQRIIKTYEETGQELPVKSHKSSAINWNHDQIKKYLEENLTIVRIHEKLLEEGVKVSYSGVRRYVSKIQIDKNICVRFHTSPSEEAQVDFGYVGRFPDTNGVLSKCYVFAMRLSYSRLDYYETVFDQKVETFIKCHINAFKYFGGVVKTVKIDNLKAAILEANFYEPTYQILYKQFADFYSFIPLPCRVRKPQEKGKVENGIKYVQINFFAGRKFNTNQELNIALRNWLDGKCNLRLHGTTKKIPKEVFDSEEKNLLTPLAVSDFIFPNIVCRKVNKDCHVTFANNYYSVPFAYINKIVEITTDTKLIKITYNQEQVAIHQKAEGKGNFITNNSHYPKYKLYEPNSIEYQTKYRGKLEAIGEYAGILFSKLLSVYPQTWYQMVKGILSLEK